MKLRAHRLKTWPEYFQAVKRGDKTCEVRKADRDYQPGDFLLLIEFDPKIDRPTGAYCAVKVTHILTSADPPRALIEGHVAMSIDRCGGIETEWVTGADKSTFAPEVEWLKPAA